MPRIPIESIYTTFEPEPDWLIPEVLHKGNQVLLCGLSGIGKSIFSYALANALATGSAFIGPALAPARVLYFDEENSIPDLSAYARWTWRGFNQPPLNLLSANLRIEARTLSSDPAWGFNLRALASAFKPDLIIIDTATPACHITDENDNSQASIACQQIRAAQDASSPTCAAIILKHLRIDSHTGATDVRGAKYWKGAVDSIWYHTFRPGRPRTDGWRNTQIRSEKGRAFGLRHDLLITPHPEPNLIRLSITLRSSNSDPA